MLIFRLLWTKKIWVKWFTPQQMAFLCTIIHIMVRKIICHLWCLSCSKEFKNQLQWRSSVLCGQPTLEKMPTIPHSVCYLIKILQCPQQQGKCLAWLLCLSVHGGWNYLTLINQNVSLPQKYPMKNLFQMYNLIECLRPSYRFMLRWLLKLVVHN